MVVEDDGILVDRDQVINFVFFITSIWNHTYFFFSLAPFKPNAKLFLFPLQTCMMRNILLHTVLETMIWILILVEVIKTWTVIIVLVLQIDIWLRWKRIFNHSRAVVESILRIPALVFWYIFKMFNLAVAHLIFINQVILKHFI